MASWTEEDVAKLKEAVSSGVLSVSYDGPPRRTITYQSLTEMRALLADMERVVAPPSVTRRRAAVSRGFDRGGRSSWRRNE